MTLPPQDGLPVAASHNGEKDNSHELWYRDHVAKHMTSEQIAEAQRLAREWKPEQWDRINSISASRRLLRDRQTRAMLTTGKEDLMPEIPVKEDVEVICANRVHRNRQ